MALIIIQTVLSPCEPIDSVFLDFEFWDLPGGRYDVENLDNLDLQTVGACLFVIDAQVWLQLIFY